MNQLRRVLSSVEELNSVYLQIKQQEAALFYDFSLLEACTLNGNTVYHELRKLYHFSILPQDSFLQIHAESFDRQHFCKDFSTTEKEFCARLAQCDEEVLFRTNHLMQDISIENLTQIQEKLELAINRLSNSYRGEAVSRQFEDLRLHYSNPTAVLQHAKSYNLYGLFLFDFYGMFAPRQKKSRTVRFTNWLPHCIIDVVENVAVSKIDEMNNYAKFSIEGYLPTTKLQPQMAYALKQEGIEVDRSRDSLMLHQYSGNILCNQITGLVEKGQLNMHFSIGQNFEKKITYNLNAHDSNN